MPSHCGFFPHLQTLFSSIVCLWYEVLIQELLSPWGWVVFMKTTRWEWFWSMSQIGQRSLLSRLSRVYDAPSQVSISSIVSHLSTAIPYFWSHQQSSTLFKPGQSERGCMRRNSRALKALWFTSLTVLESNVDIRPSRGAGLDATSIWNRFLCVGSWRCLENCCDYSVHVPLDRSSKNMGVTSQT